MVQTADKMSKLPYYIGRELATREFVRTRVEREVTDAGKRAA